MAQLLNVAEANGIFNGVPVDAATELSVELTALQITKSANMPIWVEGELEYTLVVKNIDERPLDDPDDPGFPVTGVNVEDTIVATVATLVDGSVMIDGVAAVEGTDYTFDSATGLLTVILGDLNPSVERTITFRIIRPQP